MRNNENLIELVKKAKNNEKGALECIMKKFDPFIYKTASSIYVKGYDIDDLKQTAYMAVMKAVQKFDPQRESRFEAYVMISIKNSLFYIIRNKCFINDEVSIFKSIDEGIEIQDSIAEDYNLEDEIIRKEEIKKIRKICSSLEDDEKELLKFIIKGRGGLSEYSKKKGMPYTTCFKRRAKLMKKLRRMYINI